MKSLHWLYTAAGLMLAGNLLAAPPVKKGIREESDCFLPVTSDGKKTEFRGAYPTGAKPFRIQSPKLTGKTICANDFGVSEKNPDNAEALNRVIQSAAPGTKITLKKGVYRFVGGVRLHGKKDFVFDGNYSEFIFLRNVEGCMIHFGNCERIEFRNLILDWDWEKDPLAALATVHAVDPAKKWVEFKVPDFEKKPFPKAYTRIFAIDPFDPETKTMGVAGGFSIYVETGALRKDIKRSWKPGGIFRFEHPETARKVKKDGLYRLRTNGRCCGFLFSENHHMLFENVTIHSAPGAAMAVNGEQSDWIMRKVIVTRKAGRCMTSGSDILHFNESKGNFLIENCDFSFSGDDCINVHDLSTIAYRVDDHTLEMRLPHNGSWLRKGNVLELREDDFAQTGFAYTFVSAKRMDPGKPVYRITFQEKVPEPKGKWFVVFNRRFNSRNIIIRNNYFHEHRARSLLLHGSDITVENNRFYRSTNGSILIQTGYLFGKWNEGYGAANIVIRNNVFENTNPCMVHCLGLVRDLWIGVYIRDNDSYTKASVISGILITGNTFRNPDGLVLYASSADGVIFENNTVIGNRISPGSPDYRGSCYFKNVRNSSVRNNVFRGKALSEPGISYDRTDCSSIVSAGNRKE